MADHYVKLWASILQSSIWSQSISTRVVWITMLAMADEHGFVGASVDGIARMANVTLEEARSAIDHFLSPDPLSRNADHDGRRIQVVPRGWHIINHGYFKCLRDKDERREYERVRKAEQRARAMTVPSIYFAEDERGLVKIGSSEYPGIRVQGYALRAQGAVGMVKLLAVVDGTRTDEANLHRRFAEYRVHGEWFKKEGELASYLEALTSRDVPPRPATSAHEDASEDASESVVPLRPAVLKQQRTTSLSVLGKQRDESRSDSRPEGSGGTEDGEREVYEGLWKTAYRANSPDRVMECLSASKSLWRAGIASSDLVKLSHRAARKGESPQGLFCHWVDHPEEAMKELSKR